MNFGWYGFQITATKNITFLWSWNSLCLLICHLFVDFGRFGPKTPWDSNSGSFIVSLLDKGFISTPFNKGKHEGGNKTFKSDKLSKRTHKLSNHKGETKTLKNNYELAFFTQKTTKDLYRSYLQMFSNKTWPPNSSCSEEGPLRAALRRLPSPRRRKRGALSPWKFRFKLAPNQCLQ